MLTMIMITDTIALIVVVSFCLHHQSSHAIIFPSSFIYLNRSFVKFSIFCKTGPEKTQKETMTLVIYCVAQISCES